ncbi:hypothetical protein NC653_022684 [Populus alba x Populus x berolinensis]|uniref:Uncharacterized protein n=1 Tax=Populus alba x Populus x berolinensis TaxID=444605 RepID=A0AAD6MFB2_9ROSI|nr:hypothetical protein NC653_022684 [Populus alba x Populus x berolinensis]
MAAVLAFDTSVTRYYQEEREWSVLSSKLSRAPMNLFFLRWNQVTLCLTCSVVVGCRKGCTASERNLSQEVALPHPQQAVTK